MSVHRYSVEAVLTQKRKAKQKWEKSAYLLLTMKIMTRRLRNLAGRLSESDFTTPGEDQALAEAITILERTSRERTRDPFEQARAGLIPHDPRDEEPDPEPY